MYFLSKDFFTHSFYLLISYKLKNLTLVWTVYLCKIQVYLHVIHICMWNILLEIAQHTNYCILWPWSTQKQNWGVIWYLCKYLISLKTARLLSRPAFTLLPTLNTFLFSSLGEHLMLSFWCLPFMCVFAMWPSLIWSYWFSLVLKPNHLLSSPGFLTVFRISFRIHHHPCSFWDISWVRFREGKLSYSTELIPDHQCFGNMRCPKCVCVHKY